MASHHAKQASKQLCFFISGEALDLYWMILTNFFFLFKKKKSAQLFSPEPSAVLTCQPPDAGITAQATTAGSSELSHVSSVSLSYTEEIQKQVRWGQSGAPEMGFTCLQIPRKQKSTMDFISRQASKKIMVQSRTNSKNKTNLEMKQTRVFFVSSSTVSIYLTISWPPRWPLT